MWAFNEEVVARAIYNAETPVISAVGHEPDVTIADYVADVRAATPSHAAELVAPDQRELRHRLEAQGRQLAEGQRRRLTLLRTRLAALASKRVLTDPMAALQEKRMILDYVQRALGHQGSALLSEPRRRVSALASALEAMSPLAVLGRGYAMASKEDGSVLRSAGEAAVGERITMRMADGLLGCRVEEVTRI